MRLLTPALIAACCLLTACATRSGLGEPQPAEPVAPVATDPRICAPVIPTPEQPDGASIVAPVTAPERTATALFLGWVAHLADVAAENEGRARLALRGC